MTDQDWFWMEEWQAGEADADWEAVHGEGETFLTGEVFLRSLDSSDSQSVHWER